MENANERDVAVVVMAQCEYSSAFAGACGQTQGQAPAQSGVESELTSPGSAARLNDYATGLKKIMELEASRNEMRQRAAAAGPPDEFGGNSAQSGNGRPLASSNQESIRIIRDYENRVLALQAHNALVLRLKIEAGAQQAEVEQAYADQSMEMERRKRDFQIQAAGQTAGMMANFMQNLYVATGSKNMALFEMMKAFSIARAMISGTEAVVSAYAWGAYFGGPALGAAFAAVAAAATAAQIAQIAALSPGGAHASIGAGGLANPSYHGGSTTAHPAPQRLEDKGTQNVTLIINNPLSEQNWQKIAEDNIIPALNAAADRNIVLNMVTA